jgi:hypothetical protein
MAGQVGIQTELRSDIGGRLTILSMDLIVVLTGLHVSAYSRRTRSHIRIKERFDQPTTEKLEGTSP